MAFTLNIGFRASAAKRPGDPGKVARFLFGTARITLKALRKAPQTCELDKARDRRLQI